MDAYFWSMTANPNSYMTIVNRLLLQRRALTRFQIRLKWPDYKGRRNPEWHTYFTCQWGGFAPVTDIVEHVRPYLRQAHLDRFVKETVQVPPKCLTIHIRMGDVPFIKHSHYYLPKLRWLQKAIAKCSAAFEPLQFEHVTIMSSTKHESKPSYETASEQILNIYVSLLQELDKHKKYSVRLNNTDTSDLYYMMNSAALVSCGSSFSAYAGLVSDEIFLCCGEVKNDHKPRKNFLYLPFDHVLHDEVDSYENIGLVSQRISEAV